MARKRTYPEEREFMFSGHLELSGVTFYIRAKNEKDAVQKAKDGDWHGRLELDGVTFYIRAKNEKDAVQKAKDGDWHGYDDRGAETVDWDLDLISIEPND